MARLLLVSLIVWLAGSMTSWAAFSPREVAVIANANDPLSMVLARHYVDARGIPPTQLIEVRLPPDQPRVNADRLTRIRARVLQKTPAHVQAYVLAWMRPYRVKCMSMTTAFAAGFDEQWCAKPCARTRLSDYFDSSSAKPWQDHGVRPAMLLAARDESEGRALIARGLAADGTRPSGTGYLVQTSDRHRNVRAVAFPALVQRWSGRLRLRHERTDALRDRDDVLFYFTGAKEVVALRSNRFLPGAVADHLTSSGGRLDDSPQMSALRWLEAGATASYGTVAEPCAYREKFPDPTVLLSHYYAGDSVIEAYWKSVAMPGQGLFIGEPLARPFTSAGEQRR
ncbi:MAG: TIGR03790 family protein [Pseudomonadota bacterium]